MPNPHRDLPPKDARDNRANQLNPTHPAYHRSRGASPEKAEDAASEVRREQPESDFPDGSDEPR
jgi:hypothetical protein